MRWAAAVLLALCPGFAYAWSAAGHRAVARVAADLLAAQAAAGDAAAARAVSGIQSLLGTASLEDVAVCPDQIRRGSGVDCAGIALPSMPRSGPWHYVSMPIADSPDSPAAYCAGDDCVVNQIDADVAELQNPTGRFSSEAGLDRQMALIFLVHFVGDEHQPLHCAEEDVDGVSDQGGNLKPVSWAASARPLPPDVLRSLNLHAVWDQVIEPTDDFDPADLSRRLEKDLQGTDTSSWLSGDFVARTAMEGFAIAKSQIYPAYHEPDGDRITSSYQSRMQPLAFRRLEMAGVRLAELLRRAFSS